VQAHHIEHLISKPFHTFTKTAVAFKVKSRIFLADSSAWHSRCRLWKHY